MNQNSIPGAAVLSKGPALGHGITIDEEGMRQALSAMQRRGKVKLIGKHDGEFEDIVGYVSNFRRDGDQIRGDIELLPSHPMTLRIQEITRSLADQFGLSIESIGQHELAPGGGQLFRCTDIDAIALVPRPAANPRGLFGAKSNRTHLVIDPKLKGAARFSALVEAYQKNGSAYPFMAAVAADRASYNDFRKGLDQAELDCAKTTNLSSEVKKIHAMPSKDRGQAILRFAKENPQGYSAARAAGQI